MGLNPETHDYSTFGVTKPHDYCFGGVLCTESHVDSRKNPTIIVSETKWPKPTIIRHATIIRLLLVLNDETKNLQRQNRIDEVQRQVFNDETKSFNDGNLKNSHRFVQQPTTSYSTTTPEYMNFCWCSTTCLVVLGRFNVSIC